MLAERLGEVAEDARLGGALDERLLRVRADNHDRQRPLAQDAPCRLDPVEAWHLHIEDCNIRLLRARELDGLGAVTRLRAHHEADPLEHRAQVEADQRFVFSDEHPHASIPWTFNVPSSRLVIRTGQVPPTCEGRPRKIGLSGLTPTARRAFRSSA